MLTAACGPLPEVAYETERLEIAVGFDAPVCQGTLDELDDHVARVEFALGTGYGVDPLRVYWLRQPEIDDRCGEGRGGCFFPSTRVLFSGGYSLTHELVHAVLDSEGESYFVEEGMAEMLSGVGVYYDVDNAAVSPAAQLQLSRYEYRGGGLDYAAASHFVRWVYETAGAASMQGLADEIEERSTAAEIERRLEVVLGESMQTIAERYRTTAPDYYPGLAHGRIDTASIEALAEGLVVDLSCVHEDTRGPLPNGDAGMYRVFRVPSEASRTAMISVDGPTGAFVELIDPAARVRDGKVQDWTMPNVELDRRALRVEAGQDVTPQLRRRTYLLVVAVTDADQAAEVTVTFTPAPSRSPRTPKRLPGPTP